MENIKKDKLQALVNQLVGKEWNKYRIMDDLYHILYSNENYDNKIKIVDSSSYANYFVVCEKETSAILFSVEIKRKRGQRHFGYVSSYWDWTIKEVIITNYNENVQADIDKLKQSAEEEKRKELEAKEVAKKVIHFLKEQGYDYWNRRKIINAIIYEDEYSLDQED